MVLGNLSAKLNTSVCDFKLWSSGNVFVCRKAVILSDLEVISSVLSRVSNKTKQSGLSLTGHKKGGKAGQSLKTDAQAPLCILFTYILNWKLFFVAGLVVIPCSLKSCTNNALCTFSSGLVACRCPDINDCSTVRNPVCGSDGTTQKIYDNLCSMEVESCKLGKTISPVPDEKCG